MNRIYVKSSMISSIGYDESSEILEIEFNDGSIYEYYNVPIKIYSNLINNSSKGKFFHRYIRDHYRFKQIKV